jgi:hypothetical protein
MRALAIWVDVPLKRKHIITVNLVVGNLDLRNQRRKNPAIPSIPLIKFGNQF